MKRKTIEHSVTSPFLVQNLSKAEAAAKAGICVRKLEQLIYDRQIAHVRIGRRVLIPLAALDKFIQERTTPAYKTVAGLSL